MLSERLPASMPVTDDCMPITSAVGRYGHLAADPVVTSGHAHLLQFSGRVIVVWSTVSEACVQ